MNAATMKVIWFVLFCHTHYAARISCQCYIFE